MPRREISFGLAIGVGDVGARPEAVVLQLENPIGVIERLGQAAELAQLLAPFGMDASAGGGGTW